MNPSHQRAILIGIVAGVALGLVCGIFLPSFSVHLELLGSLFMKMLKMIVVPLVLTSIIVGISSLGDIRRIGRTGGLTLGYYITTTIVAVCLGILLVTLVQPGAGAALVPAEGSTEGAAKIAAMAARSGEAGGGLAVAWNFALDMLNRMIAANLLEAMASDNILPLIVFSLLLGGVLSTLGSAGEDVLRVVRGLNEAIMALVMLIMWFAPVGIFALVATRFGKAVLDAHGIDGAVGILRSLGLYMGVVLAGLAVHSLIVLPLLLYFVARRRPATYARNMTVALLNAFGTASSMATLPITMECTEKVNKVSPRASQFVLPLGATINMDGTALYEAVAAMFIAQSYGIDLGAGQVVVLAITATLAAIGAAGIPEAGLFTMVMVLQAVGLPVEGIGMILVIDWLLDRFRTTVNVWGDAVGAAVVDRLDSTPAAVESGANR